MTAEVDALQDGALKGGALVWGVKASLVGYVRGMADGRVEATGGAEVVDDGFRFPRGEGDDPLAFRGSVALTGHGGMLRVVIADPALRETAGGWAIEIADPDEPEVRLRFATLQAFDGERATGTALTAEGADLFFFGPYAQGTPLDDPVVA
ncbi:HtaA domain-containing protein [Agrococcus beijingensis]|uniref:HtaA domain-containing protein n=1 Tax=Agrococcus beijingensis TaxID=3068634 RepID=UPI0027412DAA|nr:HtaA domain-containing protein [Agrococcus sp. REN33]